MRMSPPLQFWGKNPLEQETGKEEGARDGHHPLGARPELGVGARAGFGDGQGMLKHAPAPQPWAAPLPGPWPTTQVL